MARGRRILEEGETPRVERVVAIVTGDDKRAIFSRAAQRGMSVSDYILDLARRDIGITAAKPSKAP